MDQPSQGSPVDRSSQLSPTPSVSQNVSPRNVPSYSQVASINNQYFPKREQAIIMNSIDTLQLTDYVTNIGSIIGPRNVIFASRMSNQRICIYLSEVKYVDQIVQNHSQLKISDHEINIRKLITPAKRIILSNVCPSVPHNVLEAWIRDFGFKLVSPVSFLRAGIQREEYSHVLSFRRQVYVQPDENISLPPSEILQFEDTNYRIFLSFDDMVCFHCKKAGHVAKNCPLDTQSTTIQGEETAVAAPKSQSTERDLIILQAEPTNNQGQKRLAPSNPSSSAENPIDYQDDIEVSVNQTDTSLLPPPKTLKVLRSKTQSKKLKISTSKENITNETNQGDSGSESAMLVALSPESSTHQKPANEMEKNDSTESIALSVSEMLTPAKSFISEANPQFILTFEQLVDFLENVRGSPDPLGMSYLYTDNTPALVSMLGKIHPKLVHRSIKCRITRVRKKITKQLAGVEDDSECDTDASQMSY